MCSETSTPPRLSFSHNLSEFHLQKDVTCIETLLLDSNSDFEFNTCNNILEFESSSADELFSNGVILPKKHTPLVKVNQIKLPPRPSISNVEKTKNKTDHKLILAHTGPETVRELLDASSNNAKKHHSKSFWGFGRSKSLNCDTKKNLSFSSPFLLRSNSTGSAKKPSSSKQTSTTRGKSSSLHSCSSTLNLYPMQKSNSGKSYGGSYGNGHWISPVLNVPTPCVSKGSASFFRFGSILSVGKVKKNKK